MSTSKARSRPAPRAVAYHHGDLRNALIEATIELIPESGVPGLSLREVSRRAGVSHAAAYRHFRDKEALLAAVAEAGFAMLAQALQSAAKSAGPEPLTQLQIVGVAYVDFALRHPAHLHVMFGGAIGSFDDFPSLQLQARAARSTLHEVIVALRRTGEAVGVAEEVVEAAAWSIVHGLSVLLADGQLRGPEGKALPRSAQMHLAQTVTRLFCAGLDANDDETGR